MSACTLLILSFVHHIFSEYQPLGSRQNRQSVSYEASIPTDITIFSYTHTHTHMHRHIPFQLPSAPPLPSFLTISSFHCLWLVKGAVVSLWWASFSLWCLFDTLPWLNAKTPKIWPLGLLIKIWGFCVKLCFIFMKLVARGIRAEVS